MGYPAGTRGAPPLSRLANLALAVVVASVPAAPAAEARRVRDRLLVVRDAAGDEHPVRSPADWERRRREILHGMELAMGAFPDRSELPPPEARVLERIEGDVYVRERIAFEVEPGDRLTAYLYTPRGRVPGARSAALLALHPTSPLGKGVVAGESERANRGYALELARRGYVVLAPDYPSFGEYPYDFSADRYASGSMKGVFNHARCIDLLAARDDVDPERIGAIGHSLGGHNAIFLGVFDRRVRAVVSSCGWTPFHDYYGGKIAGWTSDRYMPRLRDRYGLDPDRVPFDFYEVVAALAPRAFFSSSPLYDENFAVEGVRKAIPVAGEVYRLLGAERKLAVEYPDAGHDFPPATREPAYRFLDEHLGHTAADPRRKPLPSPGDGLVWGGIAEADITPPPGWRMSGYFRERFSTGVHDPLHARAIWIGTPEDGMALVLCDIIGISLDLSRRARALASARAGIPATRIVVAATHSHTGPLYFGALREHFHARAVGEHGTDPAEGIDYTEHAAEHIADAVARARALARPVRLKVAVAEERRLSFNRRFHMKDGSVRFNPGKLNPDIVRAAGPIDPEAGVLALEDAASGKLLGSLTVFALHLDTAGGTEMGADFPFYLSRALAASCGSGFRSVFAAGTCGDINHIDVSSGEPQKGQDEAERIGTALAETVRRALEEAAPLAASVAGRSTMVDAPLQAFPPERVERARRDLELVGTGKLPFLEQVEAYKIVACHLRGATRLPLEVQAFRLAPDVALVALPGEVFVELGLAIKARSPFRTTLVIELANDAPGYLPTRKAFAEGSYETVNSRVEPGGGELLVEAAVALLEELAAR